MRTLELVISDLWHVSKAALYGKESTRWDRMKYIKNELLNNHQKLISGMNAKQVWFKIEQETSVF